MPELRPGDIVIMNNLSSHKRPSVKMLIEAASASLRFLPPYSHDFNPIEKAFSRLKAMLRKAGERTVGGLWVGPDRQACRSVQAHRMSQLLQFLRLSTRMSGNRSRSCRFRASERCHPALDLDRCRTRNACGGTLRVHSNFRRLAVQLRRPVSGRSNPGFLGMGLSLQSDQL